MAEVRLSEVNKVYEGRGQQVHAVRDLDLVVEDGEFVSIVGPSGCGKSTTLRMIVGLEQATSARSCSMATWSTTSIRRSGTSRWRSRTTRSIPTSAPRRTSASRWRRGAFRSRSAAAARELAGLLQIENILHQQPNTLSGGQKQRVSLARALIREPAAFILDEVLGHVDGHLRFQMLFDLKRLHQSLDSTMIFVTHDQMEAIALSDRIAVLHQGRLVQSGTRDELYDTPATRFVADFIGEPPTNFFRRPIRRGRRGGESLCADDLALRPTAETAARLRARDDQRYVVGIRPQNLLCTPRAGTMSGSTPRSTIHEYLGERSILTLRRGGQSFQALASAEGSWAPDDPITLYYRPEDIMVFDAESEALIA